MSCTNGTLSTSLISLPLVHRWCVRFSQFGLTTVGTTQALVLHRDLACRVAGSGSLFRWLAQQAEKKFWSQCGSWNSDMPKTLSPFAGLIIFCHMLCSSAALGHIQCLGHLSLCPIQPWRKILETLQRCAFRYAFSKNIKVVGWCIESSNLWPIGWSNFPLHSCKSPRHPQTLDAEQRLTRSVEDQTSSLSLKLKNQRNTKNQI
jgi:hypothetical protein